MGEENSRYALKQSDSKLKTIATWSLAFWVYPDRFWLLYQKCHMQDACLVSVFYWRACNVLLSILWVKNGNRWSEVRVPVGIKSFFFSPLSPKDVTICQLVQNDWRDIELYAWSSTGRPSDGRDEKLDSLPGLFRRKYWKNGITTVSSPEKPEYSEIKFLRS